MSSQNWSIYKMIRQHTRCETYKIDELGGHWHVFKTLLTFVVLS